MKMIKIQDALKERDMDYDYTEEDGLGSIDFIYRGLSYHIWEYEDGETHGVETNVFTTGRTVDVDGDYDTKIAELLLSWPEP